MTDGDFWEPIPEDLTPRSISGLVTALRGVMLNKQLTKSDAYEYVKLAGRMPQDEAAFRELLELLSDKRSGAGVDKTVLRGVYHSILKDVANGGLTYANGYDISEDIVDFHSSRLGEAAQDAENIFVKKMVNVFDYGGALIRLEITDDLMSRSKRVIQRPISVDMMYEMMLRYIMWTGFDEDRGASIAKKPDKEIARIMTSRSDAWPYRRLTGVTRVPYFDIHTGEVRNIWGHDEKTGLYIASDVKYQPTAGGARSALKWLTGLLQETAYDGEESKAATLAGIMTAVLRPSFQLTPGWVVSAHEAGSGKSALQTVAGILCTGDVISVLSYGNADEFEKRLTGAILGGDSLVMVDNWNGVVKSELLAQIVSQKVLGLRRLGGSEMSRVANTAFTMLNGNNIEIEGEQRRRWMVTYLDPGMERPEGRQFKFDLFAETKKYRNELVSAILTMVSDYVKSGACWGVTGGWSRADALVGFTEWDRVVRGCLRWLGVGDCLATGERVRSEDTTHNTGLEMLEELELWSKGLPGDRRIRTNVLGQNEWRVSDLMEAIMGQQASKELRSTVRDVADRGGHINERMLGNYLTKKLAGQIKNGKVLKYRKIDGSSVYHVGRPEQ